MPETRARDLANIAGAGATSSTVAYHETARSVTLPAGTGNANEVISSDGDGTTTWRPTELSPSTTSISPTEVASGAGGNITFTLTGTNYGLSGMTVHFLANSGSNITSGMTVTHTSATSLSVEIARSAFVDANEPYSIKVTKASGLTHTLADALRVDNAPSFTASPNTIVASIVDNASNATHATITATDAESDTITFAEVGTTLYDKFTSATPRGVQSDGTIKGVPVGVSADETTTFTVRATSTGDGGATTKTTDQNFRFTITDFVPQIFAGIAYQADGNSTKTINFNETNNFQPDMVWIKNRDHTGGHTLLDSVRGFSATTKLAPYSPNAQNSGANDSSYGYVSGVGTDSVSLSRASTATDCQVLRSDGSTHNKHMAWTWKAGGAPSAELKKMTDGTETNLSAPSGTSTIKQSVNTGGGFSITTFTGNNSSDKAIPHGLGVIPDWVVIKRTNASYNWPVWNKHMNSGAVGASQYLLLNKDDERGHAGGSANATSHFAGVSSSAVTVASSAEAGENGGSYVMYCWKAITDHSAFGEYQGSGSTPKIIVIGFHPRLFIIKRTGGGDSDWFLFDTFRSNRSTTSGADDGTGCSMQPPLIANKTAAEDERNTHHFGSGASNNITWYTHASNGDKGVRINTNDGAFNGGGVSDKYVYMAFA